MEATTAMPDGYTAYVRIDQAPGMQPTDWLRLSGALTTVVGRNNAGKSRLLRMIADIVAPQGVRTPQGVDPGTEISFKVVAGADTITFTLASDSTVTALTAGETPQEDVYQDALREDSLVYGGNAVSGSRVAQMSSGGPRFVMGGQERAFVGQLDFLPRYELLTRFLDSLRLIPAERGIDETVPATHTVSIPDGSPQSLGQALYVHHNGETPQYRAFLEAVRTLLPEVNTLTTRAVGDNKVTISVRDELAGDLSLKRVGSGVGQLLYIIASILFSEPGRLFLIDEPTVHLHPAAERQLADFLLEHHEHEYICATHAAAFINAGRPQATWLVRRGVDGINVHGSEDVQALRRHLAAQTGITPADAVLWEKIILVEDESTRVF